MFSLWQEWYDRSDMRVERTWCRTPSHRLLSRELRIMRESSINETISPVESPRSSSSPRFLKGANVKSLEFQSRITCFSFASMSFSFTAEMQMSWQQQHNIHRCPDNIDIRYTIQCKIHKTMMVCMCLGNNNSDTDSTTQHIYRCSVNNNNNWNDSKEN